MVCRWSQNSSGCLYGSKIKIDAPIHLNPSSYYISMPHPTVVLGSISQLPYWLNQHDLLEAAKLVVLPQWKEDPVILGNALAEVLNHHLKSRHFGEGMGWKYLVAYLQLHQTNFSHLRLVLIAAENAPELAYALCSLGKIEVILHFSQGFKADDYSHLKLKIERLEKHPIPKPSASLPKTSVKAAQIKLRSYLANHNHLEALRITVQTLPQELPAFLRSHGQQLLGQGLHQQLFALLDQVGDAVSHDPEVLRWKALAALDNWCPQEMLEILEHSSTGDADLTALYALSLYATGANEAARKQSEAALQLQPTLLSLLAMGYIPRPKYLELAIPLLKQALRKAEHERNLLFQVRIALHLAEQYLEAWQPQAMEHWANWTIQQMSEGGLNHTPMRIQATNYSCLGRLYQGDTVGIEAQLRRESFCLQDANPRMHNIFDWTLAELLCFEGRFAEANEVMRAIWERIRQRDSYSMYAFTYVRVLLELERPEEARAVAEKAQALCTAEEYQAKARLAYLSWQGMFYPQQAIEELKELAGYFSENNFGLNALQTNLYLARALQALGKDEAAEVVLQQLEPAALRFGAGLRALVGPTAAFESIYERFRGEVQGLELEFLGGRKAKWLGMPLHLRQRQADILTALVLKPQGWTAEQLTLALYGEEGKASTTKSEVSSLRERVPLANKPYRLNAPYRADFQEFSTWIERGQLRRALNFYKGPLLPESVAPVVEEEREVLEESLRNAALESRDAEAVLAVAELLKGDLEVWNRAISQLPKIDPRRALAEARRSQLERNWLN